MQYFIFDSKAFNIWTTWMMAIMTTRASWNLRSILDIDEVAQTISLDATIRFQWRDPKVRQSSSCGGEEPASQICPKIVPKLSQSYKQVTCFSR